MKGRPSKTGKHESPGLDVNSRPNKSEGPARKGREDARRLLEESDQSRLALLSIAEDHQRAKEELVRSQQILQNIIDNSPALIYVLDTEGRFLLANKILLRVLNQPTGNVIGHTRESFMAREIAAQHRCNDRVIIQTETPSSFEEENWEKDGPHFYLTQKFPLLDAEGRIYAVGGISTDITERKQAEKTLQASLLEKESLLREIHHRVNNSLQIISSLFNLQVSSIRDEKALQALKEAQSRIRSMSLIHEKLYLSNDLTKIDFASYLQSLITYLLQFFRIKAGQVRLETRLDDVRLDINTAVPCGLLANELISNALKHAFPEGRSGLLRVALTVTSGGTIELRVGDDGVGLPGDLDFRQAGSFGFQIINSLVGQLEGTIDLDRAKGTAFIVAFRELTYKKRI